MKKLLLLLILFSSTANAQLFKNLYKDFLKNGTFYVAGDINNSVEATEQTFFVRTNPDGSLYSIPEVVDMTPEYPYDFRYGIGIRKLARFDYELKPKNFYDGTENQLAFSAPTSAFKGLEYQIHFENERYMGEDFKNHHFFLKHTGKYHIAKVETRQVGKINLNYKSSELRARLPIGKKFSISAGAIVRGHERAYGYNPIEIWLNETNAQGQAIHPWYTLGFLNGFTDHYTVYTNADGTITNDWIWKDSDGFIVAYTDLQFRELCMPHLMNNYNREQWDLLDPWIEIAPIVGFDFYHYKNNFWLHTYANYILPMHKYVAGDEKFSYLNRNNWGKGGLMDELELEQWDDYSAGLNFGWKLSNHVGLFVEGEYSKMWDSKLFQTTFGLNYTFK